MPLCVGQATLVHSVDYEAFPQVGLDCCLVPRQEVDQGSLSTLPCSAQVTVLPHKPTEEVPSKSELTKHDKYSFCIMQ